ncbi:DUF2523 domain-containing protein [Arhodomonas sp. SL1]|uniref:DUF2523 domain-containing protein n=1 Tax=Arhodomonas sp. SL1 TaxID=3425691 RepID=UPI003F8842A0
MPAILAPIAVFLAGIAGSLVARVLTALGLGLVTYVGASAAVEQLKGQISGAFGNLGANTVAIVGRLGVDEAMTIILSAWVATLAVQGITGGAKHIAPVKGG